MIKLLIVDDSALVRKLLGGIFTAEPDFEVRFARNGAEALEELRRIPPDVITLDIHMPDMDGLECLERIMIEQPCPVVMVSSVTPEGADTTLEALRRGAVDFFPKPSRALSLGIEELGPRLVEIVRGAARARLRKSLNLRERVRHRISQVLKDAPAPGNPPAAASALQAHGGLVLVGTSTGGPPALEALLIPLRIGFPWPIVVAQHMPGGFTGPLARRLDGLCALPVTELAAPAVLRPGHVYIGRGDADITISRQDEDLLAASVPAARDYPWHPSVDRLVRSAMAVVGPNRLVGVLMTGMGDDGAQAMTALHAAGGRTIAEAEETAVVWGMPGELAKAGGADFVLPLRQIARHLEKLLAPFHAT
ncbi:chemotaxis-specific protein-glutamate methyltransferase CheB [Acidocella sp.]|uniref:chemotaxis-specific protein-glutamate methyltransferase CheB n=1 Tax=Acidocella sp. TaxID=50710 RepID=UPI002F3E7E2E